MIKRKTNQKGFTLVELLVVVVIIGILASVAIPNFVGAQDKAKNSGVQANVHTVQMAVEQFGVDNGGSYGSAAADKLSLTVASGSYLPGNAYPKTAWNTQQALNSDIAITDVAMANNAEYGDGSVAAPTALTNYGAISWKVDTAAYDKYDIHGTGKKANKAVKINGVRNY